MLSLEEQWLLISVMLFVCGLIFGFLAGCRYVSHPMSLAKEKDAKTEKAALTILAILAGFVIAIWLVMVCKDIIVRIGECPGIN